MLRVDSCCQRIDCGRQCRIPFGHATRVMAGQSEVNAVPRASKFRVVVDLFSVHRNTRQKRKSIRKISEAKAPLQCLSIRARHPPWWYVHLAALRLAMRACQAQMGDAKEI